MNDFGCYHPGVVLRVVAREHRGKARTQLLVMNQRRFVAFGSVRLMAAALLHADPLSSLTVRPRYFRHLSSAFPKPPNKAPEPTTFAVTSRASSRFTEGSARTVRRIVARAAPAKVVAHL
jgi:hypothetical protein